MDGINQYDTFFSANSTEAERLQMVYNMEENDQKVIIGAIREGNWKLVREANRMGKIFDELYNIEEDISEETDMSEIEPDITIYMGELFDELSGSLVPENNPPDIHDDSNVDENGYIRTGWCDV